jgi:hypothetical protein
MKIDGWRKIFVSLRERVLVSLYSAVLLCLRILRLRVGRSTSKINKAASAVAKTRLKYNATTRSSVQTQNVDCFTSARPTGPRVGPKEAGRSAAPTSITQICGENNEIDQVVLQ